MSLLISGAKIITSREILEDYSIKSNNGIIVGISKEKEDAEIVINADGLYLAPGFIDTHTHGAGGGDYMDATIDAYQTAGYTTGQNGVTTVLPSTLSATNDELMDTFDVFEKLQTLDNDGADMPGLHL